MNHEQHIALREAHEIKTQDDFFAARPGITDGPGTRALFRHAFHRGFDKAAEVLRDLSWVPPPGQPFPALYLRHPDGSTSLAANEDIITVADALRPRREVAVTISVDAIPVREALAKLETEMGAEIDRLITAGAEQAQHIRSLEDYAKKLEADRPEMAALVDRFLSWPLPSTVCTDGYTHVPSSVRRVDWSGHGTNLLNGIEAEAMLAHVLEGRYVPRPAAPTPASANQWITWSGGECPLPRGTRVEIKLRNGASDNTMSAAAWRWGRLPLGDDEGDIVAYRKVLP